MQRAQMEDMEMPEHFFGSDPDEIQKLCEEFQSLYPKAIIRSESRNYAWGKKSHEESQKERAEVTEKLKSWICSGMPVSQALELKTCLIINS